MDRALLQKANWGRILPIALIATAIIFVDQITKFVVRAHLNLGESMFEVSPIRILRLNNTGSAFGLFDGQTLPLIIASIIAIVVMAYFYRRLGAAGPLFRLSLGMQLGGAVSNLADRIRDGHVTDFVDFRVWPVFNAADASITVGIALLIVLVLFSERGAKNPLS